jgi:pentatricopeptide repeat protein
MDMLIIIGVGIIAVLGCTLLLALCMAAGQADEEAERMLDRMKRNGRKQP